MFLVISLPPLIAPAPAPAPAPVNRDEENAVDNDDVLEIPASWKALPVSRKRKYLTKIVANEQGKLIQNQSYRSFTHSTSLLGFKH